MPTDYSGDPVPPKQYYRCPHCKEQSPLTKEWVGLTDEEIGDEYVRFEVSNGGFNRFEYAVRAIEAKLKEKNT
jgi:hypothetical protein